MKSSNLDGSPKLAKINNTEKNLVEKYVKFNSYWAKYGSGRVLTFWRIIADWMKLEEEAVWRMNLWIISRRWCISKATSKKTSRISFSDQISTYLIYIWCLIGKRKDIVSSMISNKGSNWWISTFQVERQCFSSRSSKRIIVGD